MNMAAQQIFHPRELRQHAIQRRGVAQAVLIQPAAARRQRMMMKQQQRMTFRFSSQFGLQPVELKLAQLTVRDAKHLAVQQQDLPVSPAKTHFAGEMPASCSELYIAGWKSWLPGSQTQGALKLAMPSAKC
jgi:hypothetical protein